MGLSDIKVSVILPVYNVEPYLRQCLDSIVNQTLKDIEIICVNDGSTDGSHDILEEYAQKDGRITVIDQENAGAGAARNNGLKIARGEYLSFLDSDDFFELDMLREAYIKCKEYEADFVVFRSDFYNNERKRFEPSMWTIKDNLLPEKRVFTYKDIKKDIFKVFNGWAWDKLYKREFVLSNQLSFQEQRTTNDLYFVFAALTCAQRIAVLQRVLAHHRKSMANSLSVTREQSWECFYFALVALRDRLKKIGIYEDVKQSYINYALHFSLWNLNTIGSETFEKLYNKLKDEYFNELGILDFPEDYFYHTREYAQYQRIKNTPMVTYLMDMIYDSQKKLRNLKKKNKNFDYRSYRIGRFITFVPRMILKFFRGIKEYGFKYTIRFGIQLVRNRLRRKKK
ncbi:MAG: glycosyltransferase family 2 protein [Christensenellales bacterium]|jgi:glycosyltransferase involved in cell wall biosynthesis